MVRSGGRAQVSELWTEERFLAERLPASRSSDPNLRARSMRRDLSASQGEDSRRCSKEWSMEREGESARLRKVRRRLSSWLFMLGFGDGEGEEGKEQGRLAMEVGVWRRVSIVSECEKERAWRNESVCFWEIWSTDKEMGDTWMYTWGDSGECWSREGGDCFAWIPLCVTLSLDPYG